MENVRQKSKKETVKKEDEDQKEGRITDEFEERPRRRRKKKVPEESKKKDYLFAIFVNIVFLYLFNNLTEKNIGFITDRFILCLPIINVSLGATVFGNFLFLFNGEEKFKSSVRIVLNFLIMAAAYTLYKFFPFDFSEISFFRAETLVRSVLLMVTIAAGVAVIIEFFKIVFNTFDWK